MFVANMLGSCNMSSITSIAAALGYSQHAGPIRRELNASQPVQTALDTARTTVKQDFANVLQGMSENVAAWKQQNPDGLSQDRQNLPANGDLVAAILDQVKSAYQQQQPVRGSLESAVTPEMKAAAIDDLKSRVADWKTSATENLQSKLAEHPELQAAITPEMKSAAIDNFHSRAAGWTTAAIEQFKAVLPAGTSSSSLSETA